MIRQVKGKLKYLAISYYIMSVLSCLGACISIIFILFGLYALTGSKTEYNGGAVDPTGILSSIMIIIGVIFTLLSWIITIFYISTGYGLSSQKRYILCMITAYIACIFFPLGTILGIFTLLELSRPEVKESFK